MRYIQRLDRVITNIYKEQGITEMCSCVSQCVCNGQCVCNSRCACNTQRTYKKQGGEYYKKLHDTLDKAV